MGSAPLALPQPNYAKFHEQQPYFMKSVRESEKPIQLACERTYADFMCPSWIPRFPEMLRFSLQILANRRLH
jgi:hypothetical protein